MKRDILKFCQKPRDPKLIVRTFVERGEIEPDIRVMVQRLIQEGALETTLDSWLQSSNKVIPRKRRPKL